MPTINGRACVVNSTPVDKVFSNGRQVYGRNLLTGTGNHTVTGANTSGYLETNLAAILNELGGQTVTVSVDYKYSGVTHGRIGWEVHIFADTSPYIGAWYSPNNDSGSGRTSVTFVVPKNITGIGEGMGFVQFNDSGTGTLSHLKLEKGSISTPWTPAPEDVM